MTTDNSKPQNSKPEPPKPPPKRVIKEDAPFFGGNKDSKHQKGGS